MLLPARLDTVLALLLARSEDSRQVPLDTIGDALGSLSVGTEEIDALLTALESAGRSIGGSTGPSSVEALRAVVPAARKLEREGRKPTVAEIARVASLSEDEVRRALLLSRVLGR